ncbi:MAG TPA: hypothetical protein VN643_21765 [Pyrinomonadaceae bacterium]|nr:hypothetical protein [Pyrinomonadaceae bacterium]
MKFCKVCGANLSAVRLAVETRVTEPNPGATQNSPAGKPWFAELATADAESRRRQEELDHRRGIAPEVRRYNEIKGGVITASVGIAAAIFLAVFMQGIILGGKIPEDTAEILSRVWLISIIPIMVGLALIVNGVFVSKKLAQIVRDASNPTSSLPEKGTNPLELPAADPNEVIPVGYSVTENTTKHLRTSSRS